MLIVAALGVVGFFGYTLLDKYVLSAEKVATNASDPEPDAEPAASGLGPPPPETYVPDGDTSDFVKYRFEPNTRLTYTYKADSSWTELVGKAVFTINERRDYTGVSSYAFQCYVTSYDNKTELRTDEPSQGTVTTFGQWVTNSEEPLPGGLGSPAVLPFFMIQSDISWQTDTQTDYDLPEGVVTATMVRSYFVEGRQGDRATIKETVKLTTPEGQFELEGTATIVFDTARGCPISYDFEGTATASAGDEEKEAPFEFQYRLEGAE